MSQDQPRTRGRRSVVLVVLFTVSSLLFGAFTNLALAIPGDGIDLPDPWDPGPTPGTPWMPPAGEFDWRVPERFTERSSGRYEWHWDEEAQRYDDDHVHPTSWPVDVNGCQTEADAASPGDTSLTYAFVSAVTPPVRGTNCIVRLRFPSEGSYEVRMTATDAEGNRLVDVTRTVVVKDLLVVVLGDSYASGEGNPEYRRQSNEQFGHWVDDRCHRSSFAGQAQAARELERSDPKTSVTFLSFACSGATINRDYLDYEFDPHPIGDGFWSFYDPWTPGLASRNKGSGVLGPYRGVQPPDRTNYTDKLPSQLDQLRTTLALDTASPEDVRQVDALIMSAGGNDAGFGLVGAACVAQESCNDPNLRDYTDENGVRGVNLATRVDQELATMPGRYQALNDGLANLPNLEVAGTYVTEYPDPGSMRNGDGVLVECDEILEDIGWEVGLEIEGTADWDYPNSELGFARQTFLGGLNRALRTAAETHGWEYVGGISSGFAGHGYCVGDNDQPNSQRYVRTAAMSAKYQGGDDPGKPDTRSRTTGFLHPNEGGQAVYRDRIVAQVQPRVAELAPDGDVVAPLDRTPPTASTTLDPAPTAAGWHRGPVTVGIDAAPGGSNAVASVEHRLDGGPWVRTDGATASVEVSGDGEHVVEARATDAAENVGEVVSTTVRIDTVDPTATSTTPGPGDIYLLNQVVAADFTCDDDRSGVASCTGSVPVGEPVVTSSVGAHDVDVWAVDRAGNEALSTTGYRVTYAICPLFEQQGAYKAGRTVPVKLRLCDAIGADASSPDVTVTATSLTKVDDAASAVVVDDAGNANPDNGFRHDAVLGGYVYNLSTRGLSSGTWRLSFTVAGDGVAHDVTFDVR